MRSTCLAGSARTVSLLTSFGGRGEDQVLSQQLGGTRRRYGRQQRRDISLRSPRSSQYDVDMMFPESILAAR